MSIVMFVMNFLSNTSFIVFRTSQCIALSTKKKFLGNLNATEHLCYIVLIF